MYYWLFMLLVRLLDNGSLLVVKFQEVENLQIFNCMGVGSPNTWVVQASTVLPLYAFEWGGNWVPDK